MSAKQITTATGVLSASKRNRLELNILAHVLRRMVVLGLTGATKIWLTGAMLNAMLMLAAV